MSLLAGIEMTAAAPTLAELEAGFKRWPTEVQRGWHVQRTDGSWAVVVDEPTTLLLDIMSIPVTDWSEMLRSVPDAEDQEQLLIGTGLRVCTRTPAEQRAYIRERHDAQHDPELHLQLVNGRPSLCGKPVKPLWRTTVYSWATCEDCVGIADTMMARAEADEAAERAEAGEHDPGDCGPCEDHAVELAQDGAR